MPGRARFFLAGGPGGGSCGAAPEGSGIAADVWTSIAEYIFLPGPGAPPLALLLLVQQQESKKRAAWSIKAIGTWTLPASRGRGNHRSWRRRLRNEEVKGREQTVQAGRVVV